MIAHIRAHGTVPAHIGAARTELEQPQVACTGAAHMEFPCPLIDQIEAAHTELVRFGTDHIVAARIVSARRGAVRTVFPGLLDAWTESFRDEFARLVAVRTMFLGLLVACTASAHTELDQFENVRMIAVHIELARLEVARIPAARTGVENTVAALVAVDLATNDGEQLGSCTTAKVQTLDVRGASCWFVHCLCRAYQQHANEHHRE